MFEPMLEIQESEDIANEDDSESDNNRFIYSIAKNDENGKSFFH